MYEAVLPRPASKDFQKIKRDLTMHKDVQGALEDLMVLLRDPTNRLSESATRIIPLVVSLFQEKELSVLKALINFSADSVANRRYLLSGEPSLDAFWAEAVAMEIVEVNHDEGAEGDEENEKLMTLINQFVFSAGDDDKAEFIRKLLLKGVVSWVFEYHAMLLESDDGRRRVARPMELLGEYARLLPQEVTSSQFRKITEGYMGSSNPHNGSKDTRSFLFHAEFLYNCTNIEDSTENFPVDELRHLAVKVPWDCGEKVDILRKLFATCGNIYSFPSYDNWQDMEGKVQDLTSGWSFLIAGAAISLGNCVSSKETQEELIKRIDTIAPIERVAKRIIRHQFEDVVYYQAYHFFNNVMDKDLALSLVEESNAAAFYENTKIVVDNVPYYTEVGHLYFKFLRKLITFAFLEGDADTSIFERAWLYLLNTDESGEVVQLLLQALCRIHNTGCLLQRSIMEKVLELGESIDISALLQKINTISVFVKSYSALVIREIYGSEKFERGFLPLILAFLQQLEAAAASEGAGAGCVPAMAQNTLRNNARFLALVVQQTLQPMQATHGELVNAVCAIASRMVGSARKWGHMV